MYGHESSVHNLLGQCSSLFEFILRTKSRQTLQSLFSVLSTRANIACHKAPSTDPALRNDQHAGTTGSTMIINTFSLCGMPEIGRGPSML